MSRRRNIEGLPVMARKCGTCCFGPNGSAEVRETVTARLLNCSQTCHSTGADKGKPDTHICRGARDWQLEIMHRLGVIPEPTDEAWRATWERMKKNKPENEKRI